MLFWLLYILSEALMQYKYIEEGNKPNYGVLFTIRGIFAIIHGAVLNVQNPTEWIPLLGFQICSFWIIFDLTLNLLRDKNWDYKGKTSGWLDKIPYKYYYILKVFAIFGTVVFYINGLKYFNF